MCVLIGRGVGGGEEGGRGNDAHTLRYTVTIRMNLIKMDSGVNHFGVSLIVGGKVTRPCPKIVTFEEKGESKRTPTDVRLRTSLAPYGPNPLSGTVVRQKPSDITTGQCLMTDRYPACGLVL